MQVTQVMQTARVQQDRRLRDAHLHEPHQGELNMNPETHVERLRARLLGKQGAAMAGAQTPAARAVPAKVTVGPEHYDFAQFPELREYANTRWYYDKQGYEWNMFREHAGVASAQVAVAGRTMINFASYNYLDLSG